MCTDEIARPERWSIVDGKPEADRDHAVIAQLLDRLVQRGEQILLRPGRRRPLEPRRRSRPRDRRPRPRSSSRPRRHRSSARLPRGYDTPPNGPGRKALSRLPRRAREGPGADAVETGAHPGPNRAEALSLQGPRTEAGEGEGKGQLAPPHPDRRRPALRPPDRLGGRQLPRPPQRRERREQAPPAVGQGRPRAAERAHPLAPFDHPAPGHRPLDTDQGAHGLRALRLDHAPAHRPREGAPELPLDPTRPARGRPRPRLRQDQRRPTSSAGPRLRSGRFAGSPTSR